MGEHCLNLSQRNQMEILHKLNVSEYFNSTNSATENFFNTFYSTDRRLLQTIWDLRLGYEYYLESPLFPIFMSVTFFFTICIPFTLVDIFCQDKTWYKKGKIQVDKPVTMAQVYDTVNLIFWNHVFFIMPAAVGQWVWTPPTPMPSLAPTMFEFCWHQLASLYIFDCQYFLYHVGHHKIRFLYRHIHHVHHRYTSNFVWVTQYMHPWELVVIGTMGSTNTWFFHAHPLTTWSYLLVSLAISVDAHSGLDYPFLLHKLDPTGNMGGSPKHDMHHLKPMTNFQPFFNHLDKFFGFYCPPMNGGGVKGDDLLEYEKRAKSK